MRYHLLAKVCAFEILTCPGLCVCFFCLDRDTASDWEPRVGRGQAPSHRRYRKDSPHEPAFPERRAGMMQQPGFSALLCTLACGCVWLSVCESTTCCCVGNKATGSASTAESPYPLACCSASTLLVSHRHLHEMSHVCMFLPPAVSALNAKRLLSRFPSVSCVRVYLRRGRKSKAFVANGFADALDELVQTANFALAGGLFQAFPEQVQAGQVRILDLYQLTKVRRGVRCIYVLPSRFERRRAAALRFTW